MKKILISSFLVLWTLSFTTNLSAQEKKKTIKKAKSNIVKLNLPSLLASNVSLQYERIMGKHTSVALGVRFMPKNNLGFTNMLLANQISNSEDSILSQVRLSSFAITPEFRYYVRKAGKGFYFAPYFRYRSSNANFPVYYQDDNNQEQTVQLSGKVNSLMLGIMIGSQFRLSKSLTLDWYIMGGHVSSNQGNLNYTSTQSLSVADQTDLKNSLEDVKQDMKDAGFNPDNIKYSIGPNSGRVEGKLPMTGIRALGLCLGYRF